MDKFEDYLVYQTGSMDIGLYDINSQDNILDINLNECQTKSLQFLRESSLGLIKNLNQFDSIDL